MAGIIKNTKLVVTLDGGVMHVAPALGIKTMAICGQTNVDKWHPWGYKELVIQDKSKIARNIDDKLILETIIRELY